MALNLINIRPGFNKEITDTAAERQYVDGNFVTLIIYIINI
tara:strand:- start:24 stop:146 length:123 start_codon:yes stop_codon:yes gene_type:complete